MPQPPILPLLDWNSIFNSGLRPEAWLEKADNPDHRERMQSILQDLKLDPAREQFLAHLPRTVHVIAIAEDWCGDVVRFAPVLMKVAACSKGKIQVRFISRAQHPDVFIRFLTNGGEAIPKFIFLSDAFMECGSWGPMPSACRQVLSRGKGAGDLQAARSRVSKMYEADPMCESAVRELIELVETATCIDP